MGTSSPKNKSQTIIISDISKRPKVNGVAPLFLEDQVPDFEMVYLDINNEVKKQQFHDYILNSWAVLFSHPRDFTPVCTTELTSAYSYYKQFQKLGIRLCGVSADTIESHAKWVKDIYHLSKLDTQSEENNKIFFPIISDANMEIARLYSMVAIDKQSVSKLTVRPVFIIDEFKKLKLKIQYPFTNGRNFAEILRVITALKQDASGNDFGTPEGWNYVAESPFELIINNMKSKKQITNSHKKQINTYKETKGNKYTLKTMVCPVSFDLNNINQQNSQMNHSKSIQSIQSLNSSSNQKMIQQIEDNKNNEENNI